MTDFREKLTRLIFGYFETVVEHDHQREREYFEYREGVRLGTISLYYSKVEIVESQLRVVTEVFEQIPLASLLGCALLLVPLVTIFVDAGWSSELGLIFLIAILVLPMALFSFRVWAGFLHASNVKRAKRAFSVA